MPGRGHLLVSKFYVCDVPIFKIVHPTLLVSYFIYTSPQPDSRYGKKTTTEFFP